MDNLCDAELMAFDVFAELVGLIYEVAKATSCHNFGYFVELFFS